MRPASDRPARLGGVLSALLLTLGLAAACGDTDEKAEEPAFAQIGGPDLTKRTFFPTVTDAMVESGSFHLEMSSKSGGEGVSIVGDQQVADGSQLDQTYQMSITYPDRSTAEIVVVDRMFYVASKVGTDGLFVEVDLEADDPSSRSVAETLGTGTVADQVRAMGKAVESVTRVSTTPASNGDVSAEYEVVVDVRRLDTQEGEILRKAGFQKIPYTFLVDEDRLLRRVLVDLPVLRLTMEMSDWGEDTEIVAPDDDEISSLTAEDLMGVLAS